jgi:hypothetical protein
MAADSLQPFREMYEAAQRGEPSPYRMPPPMPQAERAALDESRRWRTLTVEQRRAELGEEEWALSTSPMTHDQVAEMLRSGWNTPEGLARWRRSIARIWAKPQEAPQGLGAVIEERRHGNQRHWVCYADWSSVRCGCGWEAVGSLPRTDHAYRQHKRGGR